MPGDALDPRTIALVRSFSEAVKILNTSVTLESVLRDLAHLGCSVLNARYGAVGVLDADGAIEHFVTAGMDDLEIAAIGHPPRGRGLLGAVIVDGRPVRSADMRRDPRSVGFPPNHPPMTSFLGVPIQSGERVLGNLYVTEKTTADQFDDLDEWIATVLADHAALAIERAALSAARDAFISVAAHELRTPIGALRLAVETASARAGSADLPLHLRELLRELGRGVEELALEVEDLLDVSQLERGTLRVQRSTVDLRDVCTAAVDRVRWTFGTDRIAASLPATPIEGRWDRRRLERAVANVLENALRFSPPESPVRMEARAVDGQAVVEIQDHGPGIDAADHERIWQPFVRATSRRSAQQGAGLGLYIVREIVSAHGGTVAVDSQPPRGTTISVTLPFRPTGPVAT